jgi:NAD(P)-dependent dehydrogenase (short-subunit alcohol dehydrogenase family)
LTGILARMSEQHGASSVVLLTGTSSGLGRATARLLAERGARVFGGDLAPPPDGAIPGFSATTLDVCSADSVGAFVTHALEEAGRIDAVVNFAGYALGGAVEETSLEEARAQIETNFFGVVRMVAAVLPILRKQGAGRIVNVSSGAGITAGPFHAYYSASKFAVEGYTEALRHEVKPLGIQVSLLQPGSFRTNVVKNSKRTALALPEYADRRQRALDAVTQYSQEGPDPILAAQRLHHILGCRAPALRYRVGKDVRMGFLLRRLVPERWFQAMVASWYRVR